MAISKAYSTGNKPNEFVSVLDYGAIGDGSTDDTVAVQAAIDAVIANQYGTVSAGYVLFPSNREYNISEVTVNSASAPIVLVAYGAWFNVTGTSKTGFICSNLRMVFLGGTFRSTGTTTTAMQLTQTAGANNVSYNTIRDVNIINMYKGIDCYMDKTSYPSAANYRHVIDRCHIRNTTNGTKSWVGSRGIVLGGTTVGDSSGNDTQITNTLIAGFETGVYTNGVRTSINNCSIDGSGQGIRIDGSNCTISDCYLEFNDTGIDINASASSTTIISTSIASDVTDIDDSGTWTQILLCEPSVNKFQQTEITPTGGQTALVVNKGTGSDPIAEFTGTGETFIESDGTLHAVTGSTGFTFNASIHELRSSAAAESGTPILYIGGASGTLTQFRPVSGTQGNSAGSSLRIGADSGTSRSINAGGTVNASGADYAEYEYNNGLKIEKGSIVGFKEDGTLTLTYSEAVRFGIKSTNPSFVGGDFWWEGEENTEEMEALRANVDRVAYCGKVPVNVTGAKVGDYIVATDSGGVIGADIVSSPDFDQYRRAVGRVNRILDDGRAEVVVLSH